MPAIGFVLLIQAICVIHCVRGRRNGMWIMAIMGLPMIGSLAYAWFEILPQYAGRRDVRAVKDAAARKLDPGRAVRAARDALELADTSANHAALGDALAEEGQWNEAAAQYEKALAMGPRGDRGAQVKLARAELEAGNAEAARALLENVVESRSASENDRTALLLARALEEVGETSRALALYEELGRRMPGGEPHCRHAALLIKSGRAGDAIAPLEEVERRLKRMDRFARASDGDMYDWAERNLRELRGP
jgi:hypothetical protein